MTFILTSNSGSCLRKSSLSAKSCTCLRAYVQKKPVYLSGVNYICGLWCGHECTAYTSSQVTNFRYMIVVFSLACYMFPVYICQLSDRSP